MYRVCSMAYALWPMHIFDVPKVLEINALLPDCSIRVLDRVTACS